MNIDDYRFHSYLIDDYWKNFNEKLAKRKTDDEFHTLYQFEISNEIRKLNRLGEQLQPDLYTDHAILIQKQIAIIQELEKRYKEFENQSDEKEIQPIKLTYGDYNIPVKKLLFNTLCPDLIYLAEADFLNHFDSNVSKPIVWQGKESTLVYLFTNLKVSNGDIWSCVGQHFIKENGELFRPTQMANVNSKLAHQKSVAMKELIDSFFKEVQSLKSV